MRISGSTIFPLLLLPVLFTLTQCAGSGSGQGENAAEEKEEQQAPPTPAEKNLKMYHVEVSQQANPSGSSDKACTDTSCFTIVPGGGNPQLFIDIKNCDDSLTLTEIKLTPLLMMADSSTVKLTGKRLSQLEAGRPLTVSFDIPAGTPIDSLSAVNIDGQWKVEDTSDNYNWIQDKACGEN